MIRSVEPSRSTRCGPSATASGTDSSATIVSRTALPFTSRRSTGVGCCSPSNCAACSGSASRRLPGPGSSACHQPCLHATPRRAEINTSDLGSAPPRTLGRLRWRSRRTPRPRRAVDLRLRVVARGLLQRGHPAQQRAHREGDGIRVGARHDGIVRVVGLPFDLRRRHLAWDAHHRGVWRHRLDQDGVGSDPAVGADLHRAQHLAPAPMMTRSPTVGCRLTLSRLRPPKVTPWYTVTSAPTSAVSPMTTPAAWSMNSRGPIVAAGWISTPVAKRAACDSARAPNLAPWIHSVWLTRCAHTACRPG